MPQPSKKVLLLVQGALMLVAVVSAALGTWILTAVAIAAMLLVLTAAVLINHAPPAQASVTGSTASEMQELAERLDKLSSRVIAGQERTRTELVALLDARRDDNPDS